jgi:hypothetical protein
MVLSLTTRPTNTHVFQQVHSISIGFVTQKSLSHCDKTIQELWLGYDQNTPIFFAAGESFESLHDASCYLLDCHNFRTTGRMTCTRADIQVLDDDFPF